MIYLIKFIIQILNVIYLPFKLLPVKNRMVMISRESNEITLDFKMLKEQIEKENKNIEVIILCKQLEGSILKKMGYICHMFVQMYYIATSRLIVLDTYCILASVLKKDKSKSIVQIWHSSAAIKKFGYQTIDKESGSSSKLATVMRMHMNYDYAIAPSEITAQYFAEGFNIHRDKIEILGLPRIDVIRMGGLVPYKKICDTYPQIRKKKNILYAPTFRKNKAINLKDVVDSVDLEQYNLIIKLHPLDHSNIQNISSDSIILDKQFDTFEWIKISDKIISDYSAVGLESTLQNKEIYFYIYDVEEYDRTTGINIDFAAEDICRYVARNKSELKNILLEKYDKNSMREFRNKYLSIWDEECTINLATFLLDVYSQNKA